MAAVDSAAMFELITPSSASHLEQLVALYTETCVYHVALDADYYRPGNPGVGADYAAAMALGAGGLEDGRMRIIAATSSDESGQQRLIGFVTFSVQEQDEHNDTHYQRCGVVEDIFVRPADRAGGRQHGGGAGVGAALLTAAEAAFVAAGVRTLKLQVAAGNELAIGFYERQGLATRQVLMYKQLQSGSGGPHKL